MSKSIFQLSFAFVLIALLLLPGPVANAQNKGTNPTITQVVVKLNPLRNTTIAAINAAYGTTTVKPLVNSAGIYLLNTPAGVNAETVVKKMARDLRLLYAEPNFIGQAPEGVGRNSWVWGGGDAAPLAGQYAAAMLGLPVAHAINQGAGTVVAVLDRGVQLDHPALAATWSNARYDFVDDDAIPQDIANGIDEDGDGVVDNAFGHGTHVAGIIHLVAPGAQIMPIRVLDTEARTDIFRLAEAIIYATDQGATVINLSLGTADQSDLLLEVTQRATARGVIVVAAAGNLNSKKQQYPAGNQCVLSVTALDEQQVKADFANYGSWIDFAMPGVSIYSPLPNSGYGWWSGTSMAAPFLAGQAALLRSLKPAEPIRQIIGLMASTARSVDGSNPRNKGKLGVGLPAIDVSLNTLLTGNPPKPKNIISGSCFEPVTAAALMAMAESESAAAAAESDLPEVGDAETIDTAPPTEVLIDVSAPLATTEQLPLIFLPLVSN